MINPKQIPDEVVKAAQKAWEQDAESFRPNAKSIAAATDAWPGAKVAYFLQGKTYVLPLPIEDTE